MVHAKHKYIRPFPRLPYQFAFAQVKEFPQTQRFSMGLPRFRCFSVPGCGATEGVGRAPGSRPAEGKSTRFLMRDSQK